MAAHQRPAPIVIGCPAKRLVGQPGPPAVTADPAAAQVGAPGGIAHDHRLPDITVVRGFKPRPVSRQGIVKHPVVADRGRRRALILELQALAPGEVALTLAELRGIPVDLSLLVVEGGLELFEFAFAGGERHLALAELVGACGIARLPVQAGTRLIELHALALDGVAFGGKFLIGELLFEVLLALDGFIGLAFQFGDLAGGLG